jgi:NitT/TauT family transport system ATP-binding protein
VAERIGAAVHCRRLAKTYDSRGAPVPALDPLDLEVAAGQTVALVGPSGCGKSTLLRLLAGLETPSSGSARIGDETPAQLAARGGLSMAFQDAALLPWRSVAGNIALALKLARRPRDPAAIQSLIDLVGLGGFEDRRPAELSGGMRQRAAIARCLISEPELLLLDEPFGAVDDLTRGQLNLDLPALWRARGATALMVTHSVREAVLIADRVLVLSPRPARLVADIDTTFDTPRDAALTLSEPFQHKVRSVTDALTQGAQ